MKRINGMERWLAYQNWFTSYDKKPLTGIQVAYWAAIAIIAIIVCLTLAALLNS